MSFRWIVTPTTAWSAMYDDFGQALYTSTLKVLTAVAVEIENWMKNEAPWEDRTGNARNGLSADVIPTLNAIVILLSLGRHPNGGTLEYGRYLEYAHDGRYAIIGPALDYWSPKVMDYVRRMWR